MREYDVMLFLEENHINGVTSLEIKDDSIVFNFSKNAGVPTVAHFVKFLEQLGVVKTRPTLYTLIVDKEKLSSLISVREEEPYVVMQRTRQEKIETFVSSLTDEQLVQFEEIKYFFGPSA